METNIIVGPIPIGCTSAVQEMSKHVEIIVVDQEEYDKMFPVKAPIPMEPLTISEVVTNKRPLVGREKRRERRKMERKRRRK